MAKDNQQFEKSGVEKPIRSGAKEIKKKPMLQPMSDRTASEAGRWSPRSSKGGGSDQGAPYPGRAYNPPAPSKDPGQATHSNNARAVELLKPDTSGRFFKK